ncbi:post-PEP-CTERM-1 domain-containing protein [Ideonella benzenivorans]|uniref:post-PEP-CTERM-1 domain-containing protein n=1 Tax=Ideonella benzenivorans TaxID=2831643 RepID=UPI001CED0D25|nr:hypothetical protein [Ideonella benzenivorans]
MRIQRASMWQGALGTCLLAFAAGAVAQPDAEGLRVVKDPVTGQLRAPTADEAKALEAAAAGQASLRATTGGKLLRSKKSPAARGVTLGAEHLSNVRVARDAQGQLVEECVEGDDATLAAPAAVSAGQQGGAEIE